MYFETMERLTSSREPLDYQAPGAAMRLAWIWLAKDLWSRRDFTRHDERELFAMHLRHAHKHVAKTRENLRKIAAAEPQVKALREKRAMLENRSNKMSIRRDHDEIDRQIIEIMEAQK